MYLLRKFRKGFSLFILTTMLSLGITAPGYAAMLGTNDILAGDSLQQERAHVKEVLQRDEVRDQLVALGVDPADAIERVDAMTEQEIRMLAGQLEELPAGASALGLLAFVLVVLLITDLLNLTNVYNI
ncbi:PA2779 family protein [Thiohalophilus sp.]|uniref:PA2779 family protein n=1 Tax=Thiohalophilus sp. TaxID=3028392 RepID=UPI002ACED2D0|nr:PA2779 family protein [Thiohalophilus sp.]MDZ7661624.1 PA2779 family protein [Thiohalophilus sp.]MDZ7803596.1 PA2779 family protein [Thiohalophilus sp.]